MRWPRPKLRLFTCCVLMFAAAGVLYLNMRPSVITITVSHGDPDELVLSEYGWPLPCLVSGFNKDGSFDYAWSWLFIDFLTALLILFAIGLACERSFPMFYSKKEN